MKIIYTGRNIELTEALKDITASKLEKVEKYFEKDIETQVTYEVQNNSETIEITINLPGTILRAEESTPDMYESLDRAVHKLERQIRKQKTKLLSQRRGADSIRFENIKPLEEEKEKDNGPKIVRRKAFNLKPMNAEEAVLQMELLDHDFFIYMDGETGGTNVVYKRKDGNYGLIEPKL